MNNVQYLYQTNLTVKTICDMRVKEAIIFTINFYNPGYDKEYG